MKKNKLLRDQLERRVELFSPTLQFPNPPTGWVKAIRLALGISLQQLGKKLNITRQSVQEIEKREIEGAVSIKLLREVAASLDMELVYGFVPKDGSLEKLIERKAYDLAKKIVLRTSNTMKLEDQENSLLRIKKAIDERVNTIKQGLPKSLWD